jgi:hypothetical protein
LPDQSQESKYVEGVILDNEMGGRTEGIEIEMREKRSQAIRKWAGSV